MKCHFSILLAAFAAIIFTSECAFAQVVTNSSGTDTVITTAHIQKAKQRLRDKKRKGKRSKGELSTGTRLLGGLAKALLLNTIDSRNANFEYDPVKYPLQSINPDNYRDYKRRLNLLDPISYRYFINYREDIVNPAVKREHRENIFQ